MQYPFRKNPLMSLTQTLQDFIAQSAGRIPPEAIAIMEKATADFAEAGIGKSALGVGDKLPDANLIDTHGNTVSLSSLLAKGPLVINFYRGGWCPYCNMELKAYQDMLDDIQAKGATLVAISPEKPDNSLTTSEKNALRFPVLTDNGNKFASALGLVFELTGDLKNLYEGFGIDLPGQNADSGWTLPIPAVYTIAADGTVLFADVDLDYRRRAEPADAIAALG